MIRVFPHRTKWTPTDDHVFIGGPHFFAPENHTVYISITFTWDIPEGERLQKAWAQHYTHVKLGGPAFGDRGGSFTPGKFIKHGVTITSRGCPRQCPWCFVPEREGGIRELPIQDGWIIQDNNLLACSRDHIEAVFDMCRRQKKAINFAGGLDPRLLSTWHIDQLKTIKIEHLWFSCDYAEAVFDLERVADLASDFRIDQKRCYVLIGFNGEPVAEAEKRLNKVYEMGFLPFAQLYQDRGLTKRPWAKEWGALQRKWCRPAAYRGPNAPQ